MPRAWLALLLALLPSLISRATHAFPKPELEDFRVYYTAAVLARDRSGSAIYSGADAGVDPQARFASEDTAFARAARGIGLPRIKLYVYPPVLADLLIPFTFLTLAQAGVLWIVINLLMTVLAALLIARLLGFHSFSAAALFILLAIVVSEPIVLCLVVGQVTLLLLLLWTGGVVLYRKGWLFSAALFALATAIKLTPLIVIVPFLFWREWKWLRAYAVVLGVLLLAVSLVNTPGALYDYFIRVVPPMSNGIAFVTNESLPGVTQVLYFALHGVLLNPRTMTVPKMLLLAGKLTSLAVIAAAVLPVYRLGARMRMGNRLLTLTLLAALTAPVAPVSFRYGYAMAFPALALLWEKALRSSLSGARLGLLTLCTMAVTSNSFQQAMSVLSHNEQLRIPALLLLLVLPVSTVALVVTSLLAIRTEHSLVMPAA